MTMEQIKQVYAEYMKRREVPEQQDIDPEQVQVGKSRRVRRYKRGGGVQLHPYYRRNAIWQERKLQRNWLRK